MDEYCGYLGWFTCDGRESCAHQLPTEELVNTFIAQHRDTEKVVIAIGTLECAHAIFIMRGGHITHAPYHHGFHSGIGTPELLAAQEQRRQAEQEEQERYFASDDGFDPRLECRCCGRLDCDCPINLPICSTCGGNHDNCEY